jgi:hypothetical protein
VGRVLSVARARVADEDRATYLGALGDLAAHLGGRGRHFWVFERRGSPGEFLEFTEGQDDRGDGDAVGPDPVGMALTQQLEELARYDAGRDARWDEITLAEPGGR